jgi:hypothetical protein
LEGVTARPQQTANSNDSKRGQRFARRAGGITSTEHRMMWYTNSIHLNPAHHDSVSRPSEHRRRGWATPNPLAHIWLVLVSGCRCSGRRSGFQYGAQRGPPSCAGAVTVIDHVLRHDHDHSGPGQAWQGLLRGLLQLGDLCARHGLATLWWLGPCVVRHACLRSARHPSCGRQWSSYCQHRLVARQTHTGAVHLQLENYCRLKSFDLPLGPAL